MGSFQNSSAQFCKPACCSNQACGARPQALLDSQALLDGWSHGSQLLSSKKSQAPPELLRVKSIVFAPSLHCLLRDMNYKCTHSKLSKVDQNSLRYSVTLLTGSSLVDAGYISD